LVRALLVVARDHLPEARPLAEAVDAVVLAARAVLALLDVVLALGVLVQLGRDGPAAGARRDGRGARRGAAAGDARDGGRGRGELERRRARELASCGVSGGRCRRGAWARTLVRHRGADALREHRLRREARAHALERGRDGRGGEAGREDARVRRELRGRELALEDEHLAQVVVEPRARAREQRDEPLRERDLLVRERLRGRKVRGGLGVHVVALLVELPPEAVLQVLGRVFVGVLQ
jgi:hypothetical protein